MKKRKREKIKNVEEKDEVRKKEKTEEWLHEEEVERVNDEQNKKSRE